MAVYRRDGATRPSRHPVTLAVCAIGIANRVDMTVWTVARLVLTTVVILLLMGGSLCQEGLQNVENEKVCQGTAYGMSARGDWQFRYNQLKDLYTNCTYVVGNLEIIFLDQTGESYDLSFLLNIKQVTGYVLIVGVYADYLYLDNLAIIRGSSLFYYEKTGESYALFVALNYDKNDNRSGLKELRLTSLKEILAGNVMFINNNQLCFENSINWLDINPYSKPPVEFISNSEDYRRRCDAEECHPACYSNITSDRHCWGAGPTMCQKLTQGEACHPSCEWRCYGKLPNQCCHPECAGGCSGPLKNDCLACRKFLDDGECVPYCPPLIIYDNRQMMNVKNPKAKYAYGGICVQECPGFLLQDSGACVRACPEGKHAKDGKNCESCENTCPKKCNNTGENYLSADNVDSFTGCTFFEGNLKINIATFTGDLHFNVSALHPSNLTVLKHVREITGFLMIQSEDKNFTDLSFLSSLEVIHGRQLEGGLSVQILATQLKSLELTSLKRIAHGSVLIVGNLDLCYAHTIDWKKLISPTATYNIHGNRSPYNCSMEGEVCDPQCSSSGCWGKGSNKCLNCLRFEFEEEHMCLNACSDEPKLYSTDDRKCKRCHPECSTTCSGPNNTQCDKCVHVSIIGPEDGIIRCLDKCPPSMYPDVYNVCQPCHANCANIGCTGPDMTVGAGGCNSCDVGIKKTPDIDSEISCLEPDTINCQDGYHMMTVSMAGRKLCEPCHEYCETCSGPGVGYCKSCRYFKGTDNFCLDKCPVWAYGDTKQKQCFKCHSECRGSCTGPSNGDCISCSNFKVFLEGYSGLFNCTDVCPAEFPYHVTDQTQAGGADNHNICADDSHPEVIERKRDAESEARNRILIIVLPTMGGLLLLGALLAAFGFFCHRRAQAKEKTAELTARMTGFDEAEPVTPTNAQPDLAKLRLIKESELRRGGIIGSGAFGTVYKGFWIPDGENVRIPVAIKVLQDGTSPNQNKELLEEARVMASVEHVACIRILAVCMSAQMMLITQLMPLGCLLDYVRKNKEHIGSKVLLNWCTQIAKGMSYLEERGIVHRDLAARNVLVQTPTQVKITDFGLAKLLDYNEDEYHASGGKMPIKWLALECIQHRIFTHKSDVWSFGVTAWELFTYGQKPYDTIRARDVPGLLEKGERLPQPSICTIDVYMIMIKCWMLDAESRPSFKELSEEFAKMARDPGRYLVVQGDKLLRLPSHSYDKNDLIRSVSVAADGPEEVIEAEDYLQPQDQAASRVLFDNNNSAMSPLLTPGPYISGSYPEKSTEKAEMPGPPWRERNYAHLDARVRQREQQQSPSNRGREDSFNSRYSTDPIKFLRDREEIEGVSTYTGYPSTETQPFHNRASSFATTPLQTPQVVLQLPVDEDNYLAPQSAAMGGPAMYTDLSDKGYYQNEKVFEEFSETDAMLGPSVANPTYFDQDSYHDEVWETSPKLPLPSLQPQCIANGGRTFLYINGKVDSGNGYYNDLCLPPSQDSVRGQLPSESQV